MKVSILSALQQFADEVKTKSSQVVKGEPEEQLRSPFESLIKGIALQQGLTVYSIGETKIEIGKPDFSIVRRNLLLGFVELKAPGTGARCDDFKGHDLEQWKRFQAIPNILYTDGNEWALYRSGELIHSVIYINDIVKNGSKAIDEEHALKIENLFRLFFNWKPIIPKRHGKVDLKGFAKILAPICRLLRDEINDLLKNKESRLNKLFEEWKQLLFPGASNDQFSDAYAQTITFALLLSRSLIEEQFAFEKVQSVLIPQYTLMAKAFQLLTDESIRTDIQTSLDLLFSIIEAVPASNLTGTEDPWLYFYEDFLAEYDPRIRKDAGVYYTPIEVVHSQVRLIDDILSKKFSIIGGFSSSNVFVLDPALGTGTYLLGIIEHTLNKIKVQEGEGAVPNQASELVKRLFGFEIMVGPYSVSELRVSRAFTNFQAKIPRNGLNIFLTDTLENPLQEPKFTKYGFMEETIAEQHRHALEVKDKVPILVCLGNPPYDRHESKEKCTHSETGSWVRWGEKEDEKSSILQDFIKPALTSNRGIDIKNIYNLYVYFWRWALWKVFEHNLSDKINCGLGIVSFITASSYLNGPGFCGMREYIRRCCEELYIIDLGGDMRGARKEENIFSIQTPVAIAIAIAKINKDKDSPASVYYTRIRGSRNDKLSQLDEINELASIEWEKCSSDWQSPFLPPGKGLYFSWPLLKNIMPWQQTGVMLGRTWPVCSDKATLLNRWNKLIDSEDKAKLFHETPSRIITKKYESHIQYLSHKESISDLTKESVKPMIIKYSYRAFDNQWLIADNRLADRIAPTLWYIYSKEQIYFATSFAQSLGSGPAIICSPYLVDKHFFSGRGSKDIIPLFRDRKGDVYNIEPKVLNHLNEIYQQETTYKELISYIYSILSNNVFTSYFIDELEKNQIRVPITKNHENFKKLSKLGERLIWLNTYCQRFIPSGKQRGELPIGLAKCTKAITSIPLEYEYNEKTSTLKIGDGEFYPISNRIYEFEVSGLKVVQSWLDYRKKNGAGKKSSPLDKTRPTHWTREYTSEFLGLIWILEKTLTIYDEIEALFKIIISEDCFSEAEFERGNKGLHIAPKIETQGTYNGKGLFD